MLALHELSCNDLWTCRSTYLQMLTRSYCFWIFYPLNPISQSLLISFSIYCFLYFSHCPTVVEFIVLFLGYVCQSFGLFSPLKKFICFSKWQSSKACGGTKFQCVDNTIVCHDYQEIKIQESTQVLGVGAIPRSILVILKDDLADIVKAGGI